MLDLTSQTRVLWIKGADGRERKGKAHPYPPRILKEPKFLLHIPMTYSKLNFTPFSNCGERVVINDFAASNGRVILTSLAVSRSRNLLAIPPRDQLHACAPAS